ncbi:MbcA/ParS/Xre antitoxin family protein (plasmid) [Burkholderia multivorans]|uniref:MbcA/ParS/Xre antitoxin family protein n=1 Tax=Burkholderia multivorans TaxID=87883 RepID=UPI00207D1C80|nr:MbcA/ParS/Xre antitoxin family protein [Burkholderia multivorans]MCO1459855.1 MbcA/ParS/Xre antitoxin family protein [Burkholderia multivorans]
MRTTSIRSQDGAAGAAAYDRRWIRGSDRRTCRSRASPNPGAIAAVRAKLAGSTILRKIATKIACRKASPIVIARVLYVLDLAVELFEDKDRAAEWMTRGNAELDGLKPIEVLDVQPGYDRVRDFSNRALFGVTA